MDFTGPHHVPVVSARATRSRVASGEAELATKSLGRTTFLAQDDFLTRTQRQATERETVHRGRVAVDRYAREAAEQTEREVVARTREILAEEATAMERRMRGGATVEHVQRYSTARGRPATVLVRGAGVAARARAWRACGSLQRRP